MKKGKFSFNEIIAIRAKVFLDIRRFFVDQGFLELDAPALVAYPGQEPYLTPFETTLTDARGRSSKAFLHTSPEYAAKKALAAGVEKLFVLAHVFRNGEELGGLHQPEFMMLEWYRANASYEDIMDDVDALLGEFHGLGHGTRCDRLSVRDAFKQYAGIDEQTLLAGSSTDRYEDFFYKIFLNKIEPHLGADRPIILYDYPAPMAALAKLKDEDPRYAERFEVYWKGMEIANAFSELTDADEQRRRFVEEQAVRRSLGKSVYPVDEEFIEAVRRMPPSAGIALGVDRLIMARHNITSIEDVVLWPQRAISQKT